MQNSATHPVFPDPSHALDDGLLAVGGELSTPWLLAAYSQGVFPWFERDDEPILWWCPDPRAVITPGAMRVSRSLRKSARNRGFEVTFDQDFAAVIRGCADRPAELMAHESPSNTWITGKMNQAYCALHEEGYAHSVEVRRQGTLVGGLYGVSLGGMFFGESMFTLERDASKVAFAALHIQLRRWGFSMIDCQIANPHLTSLGVRVVTRARFLEELKRGLTRPTREGQWTLDSDWQDDWHTLGKNES